MSDDAHTWQARVAVLLWDTLNNSDMDLDDLAEATGVSKTDVKDALSGCVDVPIDTLSQYFEALGQELVVTVQTRGTPNGLKQELEKCRAALEALTGYAHDAANNQDDDTLCCWEFEMLTGHQRVVGVRRQREGAGVFDVADVVAVPAVPGVAQLIAAFDPRTALRVRDLLTKIVDLESSRSPLPLDLVADAVAVCESIVNDHRHPDCGGDCPGWHHKPAEV